MTIDLILSLEDISRQLTQKNVSGLYTCILNETIKNNLTLNMNVEESFDNWLHYSNFNGKLRKGYAIYFLYKNGMLVYIGKSINVKNRIKQHKKSKSFDSWKVYYCESEEMQLNLEEFLIISNRPTYNKIIGGHYYIDIRGSLKQILGIDPYMITPKNKSYLDYVVPGYGKVFVLKQYKNAVQKIFIEDQYARI